MKWDHVAQLGIMVAGGIGCLLLGQAEIGLMMLGAAMGNLAPKSPMEMVQKLPPFFRKGPGAPIWFAIVLSLSNPALAETVSVNAQQTSSVRVINNLAVNVSRATTWMSTANQTSVTFDVELDWGAASFVTMSCQTCRVVVAGACTDTTSGGMSTAKDIEVIVSTSLAGLNTTAQSSWTRAVAADDGWQWTVTNLYANWTQCTFTSTGGGAGDLLTVWRRIVSGP